MVTERDNYVINFLNKFKIAKSSSIQKLFYPSKRVCQYRLKNLYDGEYVDRVRDQYYMDYVYFINKNKPKQIRHSLLVTDFFIKMKDMCDKIVIFKIEPTYGSIRPDAFMAYEYNGVKYIAFVEIEISNKGFDIDKYICFYQSGTFREFFKVMPKIFVVSDVDIKKQFKGKDISGLCIEYCDTVLSDLNLN